jgi:hypothetical protein
LPRLGRPPSRHRLGALIAQAPAHDLARQILNISIRSALELTPPNTIRQVTEALEQLMREEPAMNRPFIAALIISRAWGDLPAPGFFDCAAHLGRFDGDATGPEARAFHAAELNAAINFWEGLRPQIGANEDA